MGFAGQVETSGGAIHPIGSTLYGVCPSPASAAVKVVTLDNFDTLLTGVTIHVKFLYGNTAASPTLNVNSTGDDIPIYAYHTIAPGNTDATSWAANSMVSLTYDGTAWRMNDAGANAAIIELAHDEMTAEAGNRAAGDTMVLSRIAPDYDNTEIYHINDLRMYGQNLYRCKVEITEAEEWTPAHWEATTVAAERVDELRFDDTEIGVASTATASVSGTGVTAATVDVSVFEIAFPTTGSYEFEYINTDWTYNSNNVNLENYGIAVEGQAANGDKVTVEYTEGAAQFKPNLTYAEFPFRAVVPLEGVKSTMVADVIFGLQDAISGIFAPIVEAYDGGLYLYATNAPANPVTIPTIVCRGVG